MPDYVQQWLPAGWIGATVALLLAVAWVWRTLLGPMVGKLLAGLRSAGDFLDDWQGRPRRLGVDPVPGVMERLRSYDERIHGMTLALEEAKDLAAKHDDAIADIRKQVQPNGGTSAHDAHTKQLGRIEQAQLAVVGTVDELRADIHQLRADKAADHEDIRHRIRHLEEHEES